MRRESLPVRVRRAFRLDVRDTRGRWLEQELDEEIRFHLEQRINELVGRGWERADAEREALARFGPFEESRRQMLQSAREREEVLTMWDRLENVRFDVRYALRQLARSPGLSAAVALTFALGIGVNATMFTVIDRVLLRPPAYVAHPETIVQMVLGRQGEGYTQRTLNYPIFKAIRDHATGLTDVIATNEVTVPVGRGESAAQARGLLVTANYFKLLGVKPRMGRGFRPEEDAEPLGAPVVIVSYEYWKSHLGGDERVIGRTLPIVDRQFTVIGVMPPSFTGLDVSGPDMWLPMSAGAAKLASTHWSTNANGTWLQVFARLDAHVPAERAAANAMRVTREATPGTWLTGKTWGFAAQPIMSLRGAGAGMTATVTKLLAAMSFIVLLVACANVANLLLARGLRRREEIAVRLALGVSRARLVSSLLVESALLALIGGVAALLVAYWGSEIIFNLLFTDVSLHTSMADGRVLAFTAAVTITIGMLTGLLPALHVSRTDLAVVLKSGSRDTGHRTRARSALLVTQAALSVVLLFAAGLFVRSLAHLTSARMGVDIDRVALGSMNLEVLNYSPSAGDRVMERALERVRALPNVSHAALGMTAPFGASYGMGFKIRGRDSIIHADAMINVVTPEYFKTLGTRLLRGRDFSANDDAGNQRVLIVNEIFATRYFGRDNPIGQCVNAGGDSLPCAEIIGVVENVRRQSIFEDSTGAAYVPLAQARGQVHPGQLLARVDHGNPASVLEPMRIAMQTAAPQLPYADVHLLADAPIVRQEFRPYRLGAVLFGVFGLLALALATIGIYGVVSYNVGQRTREMGVRIALGAPSGRVARLVVAEGVAVALIGVGIGVLLAVAGAGLAQPLLVDEPARDPLLLIGVAAMLVVTAIAASALPALRAVRTDPAIALRSE